MIFYAKNLHGLLEFTNKRALYDYLLSQSDYKGEYVVDISKAKSTRSFQQNSYLWGVVYKTISNHTGHTVNEVHEYMKRICLPPVFKKIMGKEIKMPASTADLNKTEFGDYIERIRAEVAPMGIVIPEANNNKDEFDIKTVYPINNLGESKF